MALFLYRLGRWCFRRRRWVAVLWLVALLGAGTAAGALKGTTSEEFTIPGTESQKAIDLLEQAYESRAGNIYGVKGSFLFAPLRPHPRFKALLRKMNLE